ncbi:MAG: hypothetical protein ACTSQH_07070 [Candidatus Hodarchaeales archaeon]|jgi:hypothetical protein
MIDDPPPGVRVQAKPTKERCGKCNNPFIQEIYVEPLTDKKSYRVLCEKCQYTVPLEDDY